MTPGNEKSQPYLNEWFHVCSKQTWKTPQEIKNILQNVSFVAYDRVVFNVKGNAYRIANPGSKFKAQRLLANRFARIILFH